MFSEMFNGSQPMIAFRKNTSLKQRIGTNAIRNNQKFLTPTQTTIAVQCTPRNTSRSLCSQQYLQATTFTSTQTKHTFTILYQVTGHSNYIIYLLECIMCKQYAGKFKTSFNFRLNNHRKDIKKPNAIEACKHFNNHGHKFNKHGKFIITEQLRNINTTPTETLKLRLRERENIWIKKLKTLTPYG